MSRRQCWPWAGLFFSWRHFWYSWLMVYLPETRVDSWENGIIQYFLQQIVLYSSWRYQSLSVHVTYIHAVLREQFIIYVFEYMACKCSFFAYGFLYKISLMFYHIIPDIMMDLFLLSFIQSCNIVVYTCVHSDLFGENSKL